MPNVIRVRAKPGSEIGDAEFRRLVNPWQNFFYQGRVMGKAELACCLSHQIAARQFLSTAHRIAVICEDDAIIDKGRLLNILSNEAFFPSNWELMKLSYLERPRRVVTAWITPSLQIAAFLSSALSTAGYIINRAGATKLAQLRTFGTPLDFYLDQTWQTQIVVYGAWPPAVHDIIGEPSDIGRRSTALSTFIRTQIWSRTLGRVARRIYVKRKREHVEGYWMPPLSRPGFQPRCEGSS